MLGDVGEPNPIRPISGELSLHKIIMCCGAGAVPALMPMAHAVNIGCPHQGCHAFTANAKPQAHAQLRVNPGSPIRATGILVDLHDQPGQLLILNCPSRGLALDRLVIRRRGHLQDPAGHRHREPLGG